MRSTSADVAFSLHILMELGLAASAFAVVSLAGQLGGGVSNLLTFFESIKGAPEDVRGIAKDLKLLLAIIRGISSDEGILSDVLQDCISRIRNLQDIVDQLEPGLGSSHRRVRQWTAFKTTRKANQIRKFRLLLEEMKSTLTITVLAKQQSRYVIPSGAVVEYLLRPTLFCLSLLVLDSAHVLGWTCSILPELSPTAFGCLIELHHVLVSVCNHPLLPERTLILIVLQTDLARTGA